MEFAELYRAYADSVYSYLRFKLGDKFLIEDIMQEVFLAAYEQLDQVVINPKAWLLTIAHHKMVDRWRRKQKEGDLVPFEEDSFSQEINMDQGVFLQEILARLDSDEQTLIYGLYVEKLTYGEIASMLDIPAGTIKSRAFKIRRKLRSWLAEEDYRG